MSATYADGREIVPHDRVELVRDIEMERLFGGYTAALGDKPLPRDLKIGDVGKVLTVEYLPDAFVTVEFEHHGTVFWRGALRLDEMRRTTG